MHSVSPTLEVVIGFLQAALADGPIAVEVLATKAKNAHLLLASASITHCKRFKRAKAALGIRSIRTGFGRGGDWAWSINAGVETPKDSEHAQPEPPVTDGDSPVKTRPDRSVLDHAAHDDAGAVSAAKRAAYIPTAWLAGLARLDHRRPPADVPIHRWRQFVEDCRLFLDVRAAWARRAADLGWDAVGLFGSCRTQPLGHLGMAGLLWAINGGRLARLHVDWAEIEHRDGERRTYHRRRVDPARVILPWQLP